MDAPRCIVCPEDGSFDIMIEGKAGVAKARACMKHVVVAAVTLAQQVGAAPRDLVALPGGAGNDER